MKLESERLALEPLSAKHARSLYAGLRDPALCRFIPQDPPRKLQELRKNFHRRARGAPDHRNEIWLNWALRLRSEGSYIGRVEATVYPRDKKAEIAYLLLRKYWAQGYALEACARVIECLSNRLKLQSILATMDSRNRHSIRLARRLGFRRQAFRQNADFFKGRSSNEYIYELQPSSAKGQRS